MWDPRNQCYQCYLAFWGRPISESGMIVTDVRPSFIASGGPITSRPTFKRQSFSTSIRQPHFSPCFYDGAAGSDDLVIFYALGLCIDMSMVWCSCLTHLSLTSPSLGLSKVCFFFCAGKVVSIYELHRSSFPAVSVSFHRPVMLCASLPVTTRSM